MLYSRENWIYFGIKEYAPIKGNRNIQQVASAERNPSSRNSAWPLVTVITPVYNRESFLPETIQSVLSQDYPALEYIVLDDGSTDGTPEVIGRYSEMDSRIRWERHENMGETRTVNKGIQLARGDFIMIVNSDDVLYAGAISRSVAFLLDHPDVLLGYPDWDYIDTDSRPYAHVQVEDYDYHSMVIQHRCMVGPGALIRKEAFEQAGLRDPDIRYVADFDFVLRVGLKGAMARIPHTLATWRTHPDALTIAAQGAEMAREDICMMRRYFTRTDVPETIRRSRFWAWRNARLHAARVSGRALGTKFWNYGLVLVFTLLGCGQTIKNFLMRRGANQ